MIARAVHQIGTGARERGGLEVVAQVLGFEVYDLDTDAGALSCELRDVFAEEGLFSGFHLFPDGHSQVRVLIASARTQEASEREQEERRAEAAANGLAENHG